MCAIINNYNKAWHNGYHCVYFTTRCYDKVCISNVKSGKKPITLGCPSCANVKVYMCISTRCTKRGILPQ